MAAAFVDTTILVDIQRGVPACLHWYAQQTALAITPISWNEFMDGARNKAEARLMAKFLVNFEMVYFTEADQKWAMQRFAQYKLSHSIGHWDCLIASVSHRLSLPLYTLNLKHFSPLLGTLAIRPY